MKLQVLSVAVATFFAAFGATTPVDFESDAIVAVNSETADISKRDINRHSSKEDVYVELKSVLDQLKGYVHDKYIDFSAFAKIREDMYPRIHKIAVLVGDDLGNATLSDADSVISLYTTLGRLITLRDRIRDCYYWGSDLVEEIGAIKVGLLALTPLDGKILVTDFKSKLYELENRAATVKYRAEKDPEFEGSMKDAFQVAAEEVSSLVKHLGSYIKFAEPGPAAKACPAVETVFY